MLPINQEARIETCTYCNLKCIFCPHPTTFTRRKEIMPLEKFKFIVDKIKYEAPHIKHCTISGFGDAFVDPGILDKIEYATKQGFKIHILSNGSLVTKEQILKMFCDFEVEDYRISLHTLNLKHFKKITGGSKKDFYNTIENLEFAIKNKNKTKITITTVVIDINKNDWQEIVEEYENRVDLIEVWKPHNWITGKSYRKGPITKTTCGRPFNGPLQIQVDGTINMCCFDYNGELLLGDFTKQSLNDIFNSEAYIKIRKWHEKQEKDESLLCFKCDQLIKFNPVIFNSKFLPEDRINRTSTIYHKLTGE